MFARLVRSLGAPAALDARLLPGGLELVTARWRLPDGSVITTRLTRSALPGRPSPAQLVRLTLEI